MIRHPSCQQGDKSAAEGKEGQHRVLAGAEAALLGWSSKDKDRCEVEEEWGRSEVLTPKAELLGRGVEEGEKGGREKGNAMSWMDATWEHLRTGNSLHHTTNSINNLGHQRLYLCRV